MSTTDFIPRSDPEFNLWQNNLVTESEANMIPWGLTEPDLAPVKVLKTKWESAFLAASNKQNRTSAEVQAKGDARGVYEPALRNFVAEFLANNGKVSDADRTRLGITVRSESRTASPVPASSPVGRVDFSVLLQHTVNFSDEATPTSRAKPTGVHGCEIWMKIGEAPATVNELTYLATSTASPHIVSFGESDAGKKAHYRLRWVNTRGERGPWSTLFGATIAG